MVKQLIKTSKKALKWVVYSFKNIHRITVKNIILVSLLTVTGMLIFEVLRYYIINALHIQLNMNIDVDYLAIYSCILGLVLPLAIMLIEKINAKQDYIVVEAYLVNTLMLPFVTYFCINLAIFTFLNEHCYFIFTCIISVCFVIYMYFKALKMLSDLRYEKEKVSNIRFKIIQDDLDDQLKHFDEVNNIGQYSKYGIKVANYDYLYEKNYKKIRIYPSREFLIIDQYNYRQIDKIAKILSDINEEYVENTEDDVKSNKKLVYPKIVIWLLDIGSTTEKEKSFITIEYCTEVEKEVANIQNLLTEKIYVTSEVNNHFYIKSNYEHLQEDCIQAINNSSAILLSNSLERYLDIYKDYVVSIKSKAGDYTYEVAYSHTHSLIEPRAYEILKLIRRDINDFSRIIVSKNNPYLLNELIDFLYQMMLFSCLNKELLSIQYLYNLYSYLNSQALQLEDSSISTGKIKLEVFEFLGITKFELDLDNGYFLRDVLLVCNKTISQISYKSSESHEELFIQYFRKVFKFISELNDEIITKQYNENEKDKKLSLILRDIWLNFECNFFATTAYIVNKAESDQTYISKILNFYRNYDMSRLTTIFLETINKDNIDSTYSWDLMEDDDFDEDEMRDVNTYKYLVHLYCLLINNIGNNINDLPLNYPLSTHSSKIIKELEILKNENLIKAFKKLVVDLNEEENKYFRTTLISKDKVEMFKNNFIKCYYEDSVLFDIFDKTGNIKIVNHKQEGMYYLGVNNIVNKSYFLDKLLYDKNIYWMDYEKTFANSFVSGEEKKYVILIDEKSTLQKESVFEFFQKIIGFEENYIIFSRHSTIYQFLDINVVYNVPKDIIYSGLKSNKYYKLNDKLIPIFTFGSLNEEYIYVYNINELGKMEKSVGDFEIEVNDFSSDDKLLKNFMHEEINGLDLDGKERENHLLESVNIKISEYIRFNCNNMKGYKFNR